MKFEVRKTWYTTIARYAFRTIVATMPTLSGRESCLSLLLTTTISPTMGSPAPALRDELNAALGNKASRYWDTLSSYLGGKISRVEFEELVRDAVDTPQLGMLST